MDVDLAIFAVSNLKIDSGQAGFISHYKFPLFVDKIVTLVVIDIGISDLNSAWRIHTPRCIQLF